jgi:hypothetical protein
METIEERGEEKAQKGGTERLTSTSTYRQHLTLLWTVFTFFRHGCIQLNPYANAPDPLFTSLRSFVTTTNPDGSATTHVVVKCTLSDIARATNLRIEDATFAMNECGMLRIRGKEKEGDEGVIMMTREMVERVAKERNVKRMCLDLVHVLL